MNVLYRPKSQFDYSLYEMVLEDQHCIVLLKFVSTESLQSNQEQAVTRYRASVIDFFEEYTQFLKSQENIE